MTIAIIDYGMGNIGSIRNMLTRIGAESIVTADAGIIASASKIILPGVGAFDRAMGRLSELGIIPLLEERVTQDRVPLLGVCLGMQLLTKGSEEGSLPGLGWIDARTRRFSFGSETPLPVPHMGWSTVQVNGSSTLLRNQPSDARFYFVHSYYVDCSYEVNVLGTTEYGIRFASAIGRDNVWGVQFHPEKSHRFGMHLLTSFAEA